MHRFVQAQAFDIRPIEHVGPLPRHHLRVQQRGEGDVFRPAERLHALEQFRERIAGPGDDHRPGFHAAHAVNPLLRRGDFADVVHVEYLRLRHQAIDGDLPAVGGERAHRSRHALLLRAELVKIVVMRDALERCFLLAGVERLRDLRRIRGGRHRGRLQTRQRGSLGRDRAALMQAPVERARRDDRCCHQPRLDEGAPIKVELRWSHLVFPGGSEWGCHTCSSYALSHPKAARKTIAVL